MRARDDVAGVNAEPTIPSRLIIPSIYYNADQTNLSMRFLQIRDDWLNAEFCHAPDRGAESRSSAAGISPIAHSSAPAKPISASTCTVSRE